jgi:hypothetical protein
MVERAGRGSTGLENDGMLSKIGSPLSISEAPERPFGVGSHPISREGL